MHHHGCKPVSDDGHGGKLGNCLFWNQDRVQCSLQGYFLHKHVFYRCPFLYGGPPLSDSDEDGEYEALLNLGFDKHAIDRQDESLSDRDSRSDSDREQHEEDLANCSNSYERHSDSDSH